MTVNIHSGQAAALTAVIAGESLTLTQARNLVKRGLVTAAGDELTDAGREALDQYEAQWCQRESGCTLGPGHLGDHVDANGYRSLNWHPTASA
jgi:hypothetical protein